MPLLWLIDDTPSLHAVVEATVRLVPGWSYCGHFTGDEAIEEYKCLPGEARPQVILMDYYIGIDRGDMVTAELRTQASAAHRPVIIGYSSVRSGSSAIVAAGGDLIVPKRSNAAGINPDLLNYLRRWR